MAVLRPLLLTLSILALSSAAFAGTGEDELAARTLFEKNLRAIEQRDFESYLACYWQDARLVRNGFSGASLGYEGLAESVSEDTWPDEFQATDLEVHAIADGVVYGHYHYRVRYGDDVQEGISERVFLRTEKGWRIAVTTAFAAPVGAFEEGEE
jgi:hypothetical protein